MGKMHPKRPLRTTGGIRHRSWKPILTLVATFTSTLVQAQPTFDECKIFLVASDLGRDLVLQKEPDYIRFVNLVARTHLIPHGFTTYDTLPVDLQNLYTAYAWTDTQEIDVSAAMFGAPATEDELLVLESFCHETSDLVAATLETDLPTWAPTAIPPAFDETLRPTEAQLNRDIANGIDTTPTLADGSLPEGHTSELPIQCRRGMFGSDTDRDGYLTQTEYTTFVNRLSTSVYQHAAHFEELSSALQSNFAQLAEADDRLNVFGAIPSQWTDATRDQQQFLTLVCHRTEAALMAKDGNTTLVPGVTDPPLTIDPPLTLPGITNPLVNATIVPTSIVTPAPTSSSSNNHTNSEASSTTSQKGLHNNAVAAIVGSILIVLLAIYLAHDKTHCLRHLTSKLKQVRSRVQTKWRNRRIRPQPSSVFPSWKEKPTPDSTTDFDVEEQTGFLEDQRMATLNTLLDQQIQANRSNPEDFTTVRFNPDDHIPTIPEQPNNDDDAVESVTSVYEIPTDSEEAPAPTALGFSFDRDDDDDDGSHRSDDMSLYCPSVTGDAVPTSSRVTHKEEPPAFSSPTTQYSAHRLNTIVHAESQEGHRNKKPAPNKGEALKVRVSDRNKKEGTSSKKKSSEQPQPTMVVETVSETQLSPVSLPPSLRAKPPSPLDSLDRFQKYALDFSDSSESFSGHDDEEECIVDDFPSDDDDPGNRPVDTPPKPNNPLDSLETSTTSIPVESTTSDGDSTYDGTQTESSLGIPLDSERPDDDDDSVYSRVGEIHRLVRKVLPGETGNVNRMLIQYKGREEELLSTMRRLAARMDAMEASGRPLHISPSQEETGNAASHQRSTSVLLERASTVSENAQLLASALTYGPGRKLHGNPNPYDRRNGRQNTDDDNDDDDHASFCKDGINWGPSADINDDDFSKDSTYVETSTHAGDDESISLFSA